MFRVVQWWKASKLALACPNCKQPASPETFRRGRYLGGGTPLRCEHCSVAAPVTLWRFEALSQELDAPARCVTTQRGLVPERSARLADEALQAPWKVTAATSPGGTDGR
ncbi:hypothetical protein H8A99_07930 [Bradyrhizobium sp. Arg68]|uniref:hypothetical protein n=1 Tax=Bradyrhizobium ivorense TaxID=2511166 RepID=UPI001E619052|nr:hypothetical protein [Bradyrhizobium ivorense]MCC8936430.1 hypothetical protein [Bradyrhizobium ivorense]